MSNGPKSRISTGDTNRNRTSYAKPSHILSPPTTSSVLQRRASDVVQRARRSLSDHRQMCSKCSGCIYTALTPFCKCYSHISVCFPNRNTCKTVCLTPSIPQQILAVREALYCSKNTCKTCPPLKRTDCCLTTRKAYEIYCPSPEPIPDRRRKSKHPSKTHMD